MSAENQVPKGTKVIKPYLKQFRNDNKSLEASLARENRASIPQSVKRFLPRVDSKGTIRTGLDPEAANIIAISNPEARKQEQKKIELIRNYYAQKLREDLSPESKFYDSIKEEGYTLEDGPNVFDLSDPRQGVNYYWVMQTGIVAPRLEDLESGKLDPSIVKFYVEDQELDNKLKFKRAQRKNGAISKLDLMGELDRVRVAKNCKLPLSKTAAPEDIYVALNEYISTNKTGLDVDPIDTFNKFADMDSDTLEVKTMVIDLQDNNIIRVKNGIVYEGAEALAKSIDEFELVLMDPKQDNVYRSYKEKLQNKFNINSI